MPQTQTTFYDRRGVVMIPTDKDIIRPRQGIFAIVRSGGAILLVWPKLDPEAPELPGGGIEAGETHDQALARELREETGLDLSLPKPAGEYRHVRGFYALGYKEFWIYEQTFRLYDYDGPVTPGERWDTPERDLASWEKLSNLENIPVHRMHWLGMTALIPELKNGTMA